MLLGPFIDDLITSAGIGDKKIIIMICERKVIKTKKNKQVEIKIEISKNLHS